MSYPFTVLHSPLRPWQLQFQAACDERAWDPASRLLASHLQTFAQVARSADFAQCLAEFVSEAPLQAVIRSKLPNCETPSCAWRCETVGSLIEAQLHLARAAIPRREFAAMHHHVAAAISLRPRTIEHEIIIISVMTEITLCLGRAEEVLLASYPDVETTSVAAPDPEDFRRTVNDDYHPTLIPSLLGIAAEVGVSTQFLDLGLRATAVHAHWPTWRALAALDPGRSYMENAGRNVLSGETALTAGARLFLKEFCAGRRFHQLPPRPNGDEVQF